MAFYCITKSLIKDWLYWTPSYFCCDVNGLATLINSLEIISLFFLNRAYDYLLVPLFMTDFGLITP
jgi:hypothetical protein